MTIRFMTFNSIIHDNLMPWLEENQDSGKFRLILRKVTHLQAGDNCPFFVGLPIALNEMGLYYGQKLTDEWELFSKIPRHPDAGSIVSPLMPLAGDIPKIVFYSSLIAHSMEALFSGIILHIDEGQGENLRKLRTMNYMKAFSEMIIITRVLKPSEEVDRSIINRLLAGLVILYAETGNRFPDAMEPSVLRINKADIKNILRQTFNSDEITRSLFSALADRYFPVTVTPTAIAAALTPAELQNRNPVQQIELSADQIDNKTIMEEVENTRGEIALLKEAVTDAVKNKKGSSPEPEDRRIGSAEVCVLLNISKSTLKAHRDKGLYSFIEIGSRYYYSLNEINMALKLRNLK